MPSATGSIAFLGAARFQGFWDASAANLATGSGLDTAYNHVASGGLIYGLFATGSSSNAGYNSHFGGVTANAGDYWQVTGAGDFNVDGETSWRLNDWCIFSGSHSGGGSWRRLAFEDSISSIILGDLTSSSFHMGSDNNKHVIFASGSVHSGSSNFVYDYENDRVGVGTASPAKILHVNGASGEVELRIQSSNKFSSIVQKDNAELIIQNASAGDIIFYDDSAERMRIKDGGNVGIGVSDPDELLEVAGDVKVSGTNKLYLFDSGGEYLSSDGTDLTINSGAKINLTATSDVVLPVNIGLVLDGSVVT